MSPDFYTYLILPLLIFIARIADVSIGTLRIIFISKGKKFLAPLLGFFEVMIWILAITRIMENLNNPICYLAYGLGFATGNWVGLKLEEKLAIGILLIRVITAKDVKELVLTLNKLNYGATCVEGKGSREDVNIVFTVVQRNDLPEVVSIIKDFDNSAFYTVEDIKYVNQEGIFPKKVSQLDKTMNTLKRWRLGR
ncbi:MAG: DUF2179 domain-containing protein [Bacteroidales bacterium]|nr:DUF2179 domain-containing protein [Bacteroidales bacterium]